MVFMTSSFFTTKYLQPFYAFQQSLIHYFSQKKNFSKNRNLIKF